MYRDNHSPLIYCHTLSIPSDPSGTGTGTPLGTLPTPGSIVSVPTVTTSVVSSRVTSSTSSSPLLLSSLLGPLATPKELALPLKPSHTPLILSPALPPIPANLVTKIRAGEFVDMKELLGDNIALHQRMKEVQQHSSSTQWVTTAPSPKLREINSPLSWIASFLSYVAVKTSDPNTREHLTYARLVLDMARKHGGKGWLEYDKTFRKQMACNPEYASWGELNPSLLAYAILGAETGQGSKPGVWCSLCQEPDHRTSECALQSLEPVAPPTNTPTPRSHTLGPVKSMGKGHKWRHDPLGEICRKWNRGLPCVNEPCRYKHICREYQAEDHPATSCPTRSTHTEPKRAP